MSVGCLVLKQAAFQQVVGLKTAGIFQCTQTEVTAGLDTVNQFHALRLFKSFDEGQADSSEYPVRSSHVAGKVVHIQSVVLGREVDGQC